MTGWLSESTWEEVQQSLPIVCIDAILRRDFPDGRCDIGLILRATPHQGLRWCAIGGRLRYGESLEQGLHRELTSALSPASAFERLDLASPRILQYLPDAGVGFLHDPRKHAVSMTYLLRVAPDMEFHSQGDEALDFRWFEPTDLTSDLMGFGQESVAVDAASTEW